MITKRLYLPLTVIAILIATFLSTSYAQDATATPSDMEATEDADMTTDTDVSSGETVSCDSDLILVLYIAERFFDFDTFVGEMPADAMVNLDNINKGQYEPLFTDLSNTSDTDALQISDEVRSNISNTMAMSDAEVEENMTSTMMADTNINLTPPTISGESDECAELRRLLHRFFSAVALNESSISGTASGMDAGDMTGEATEADTNDTDTNTGASDTNAAEGAITLNLSGANEVPGPGDEDGSGSATVYLRSESNEVCVDLSAQNITLPASAAHIHQGATGEAGPPVVTLNAPGENGFSSTCTTVDATLMQDLINNPGNYYVNIHTDEFPDGAIRGQMN